MKRLIAAILLSSPALLFAQIEGWLPPSQPAEVCEQVEKNVRAMYVSWAAGATETFEDLRKDMRAALSGKGKKEEAVRAIYEESFKRIEANEFSPPKFPNRATGHLAAKKFAADRCMQEIIVER